jgi:hypothetical protein
MFQATDAAREHLAMMLDASGAPADVVVRLDMDDGGVAIGVGHARPTDRSFEHQGRIVLAFGDDVARHLEGRTLDVESADDGLRLTIKTSGAGAA